MPQQLVQINFQFTVSESDYEKTASMVVEHFAGFPGLHWKIWLLNKNKKEAGGIYLFESAEAVSNYKNSILFKKLEASPAILHISFKQFDILQQLSGMTHAPVKGITDALN